ncbi:hypothetical protein ACFX2H_030624 [Malus domestica]
MYCLITDCLVHSSSIHSFRELESRVVKLAFAKLLESVADLPFVNSLAALEDFIELLPNAHLGAAVFEQPQVQSLLQVLARPLRHALRPPELLQRRKR